MVGVEDEDEDEEGVWGHVVCSPPSLILVPAPVITMSLSARLLTLLTLLTGAL